MGIERMLRIYFLQQWFNLSDPAVEEALYDSPLMRHFAQIDLGNEPVPDETTVCKFRHLLEQHSLGGAMLETVNVHLQLPWLQDHHRHHRRCDDHSRAEFYQEPRAETRSRDAPDDGNCTIAIGLSGFYICDNLHIAIGAVAAFNVPGIFCTAAAVAGAIAGIGGGGGGGAFAIPPGILIESNCNPAIPPLLQQGSSAAGAAGDPPINTTPPVTGTAQAAAGTGPSQGNESPLAFIATALGNLGLVSGQSGNDGYSAADADQMVSTLATFDQVEADIAGILTTASGEGASLGITGDLDLLQTANSRLEAVTNAENLLFGGDANWLDTTQSATLQQWIRDFFTDAQDSTNGGQISAAETTQLLATTLPSSVSISEAQEFIDRWNRTVQYWGEGIFTAAQVPSGQSTDFLDIGAIQTAFSAAVMAEQEAEVDGYSDVGTEVQGALAQFNSDLAGQGAVRRSSCKSISPPRSRRRPSAAL